MEEDAFTAFERRGWEQLAQPYHSYYADLTTQSNDALLDILEVGPDTRFLDIATGPGYVAAAAFARGADAVGVDIAAAMVEQASRLNPWLTFKVGNAEDLPFPGASFDAVGINFGMFHFSHPEKAPLEAYRVLRSGGRIGFTVWASRDKAVALDMVLRAIETHGKTDIGLPEGTPFFRFSDEQECMRVLREAGFTEPKVQTVNQTWAIPHRKPLFMH
ncbi:class I SAM-dependent methyltransferase [Paraburkholderia franconis]|uniref:class I SAM-dependent methyltransferase n=1 Tax=Paraburkholderia franconis TaxID=2654983 RepID=UPI002AAF311A|nr:methyltransferase domain-containing protein [Paraburkholderia franconis]